MSRPSEWLAILAGVLLLTEGAIGERLASLDLPSVAASGSPERLLQEIEGTLLEQNPSLGEAAARRIADSVMGCGREQGLAPELVLRVMVAESNLRPEARSPKGAIGLMQVMPYMFELLDLPGNPAHIETNIEAGCYILADNIRRLGEDDGILAYYWGSRIGGDGYLRRVRSRLPGLELSVVPDTTQGRN